MAPIKKLESINILKSLAILMVMTVHQGQLFKNCGVYEITELGQLGCQLFFVISGYTLCQSWDSRKTTIKQFYKRRITAIAPGYYFDILLFSLISLAIQYLNIPHYWSQKDLGLNHLWNIMFLHGLSPSGINSIVPGGWYIGTTMLMYLSFPFLKKLIDFVSELRKPYIYIYLPLIFVSISMSFWYIVEVSESNLDLGNNTFMYFNVLTQYPCFVMGVVIYTYVKNYGVLQNAGSIVHCILYAVASFCVTLLLFYSEIDYLFCLVPIFSSSFFCCILLLMIKSIDIEKSNIPNSIKLVCDKISGSSYEMYLLHTLFVYFLTWYIHKVLKHYGLSYLFDYTLTFIIFFLIMTVLTYYSAKRLNSFINKYILK